MRDATAEIRARGAEPAAVGNGTPEQAAELATELGTDFPLFTDPERRSYAALGARRSVARVLRPGVFAGAVRALRGGHRQDGVQGDALQLGGVVAIRPGGALVYRYLSDYAGDHPPLSEVIAALA